MFDEVKFMYSNNKKSVWYGALKTSKSDAIVIFDPDIPAPKGKLLLFNTERGAFVPYLEEIVAEKLHDLSKEEERGVKKSHGSAFQKAKKLVMKKNKVSLKDEKSPPTKTVITNTEADTEIEGSDYNADFEDDFYDE